MEELCNVQVGLGNKDWYVITGLPEIKQFCMAEDSLSHLPSQVAESCAPNSPPLLLLKI
jgi:hypothetical protein